jgi:RNA-binding protein
LAPRLTQTRLESQHGADFYLLEVELKRSPEIRALLGHVLSDEMRMRLLAELDMRVDEEGIFYLRLDKQEALAGRLVLGDADGIQLRLRPVVHPATREGALSALGALLAGRTA